ncbi:DUF6985 domain-containing protein [Shewanella pneumatophori]|uniref:DUF6985 domain-containing protein n=1 Tax=Shewanella pneumatophori TaxID=314092 RepID=A0A9X1ZKY0_9GAMM|nr:hypothetical protein [Shewanella pneumatophori]MCL1137841.1 hypothetical protein [Shewanella pneumatophori]
MMKEVNITWKPGAEFHEATTDLNAWHDFKAYGNIGFLTQEDLSLTDSLGQWFFDNQKRIYAIVCDYVQQHYQELLEESEFLDVFDEEESYPTPVGEVTEADMRAGDIFKLMQVSGFVLLNPEKNTLGIMFECAWDEEHGFGLVIQGDEVIKQEGATVAYCEWL